MEVALYYYNEYQANRQKIRDQLFSLWKKHKLDPRLQSNFIRDIEGFLDVLDESLLNNPKQTYLMLQDDSSIKAIANRVEQDCIVEAGRRR